MSDPKFYAHAMDAIMVTLVFYMIAVFVGLFVGLFTYGCAPKPRLSGPVDRKECLKSMGPIGDDVIAKFREQPLCYLDCDGALSWHFHDGETRDCAQLPRGMETPQR